ncbi:MAG TPA: 2-hydroxyacid dehydrogenase [Candidatus Binataceae bacterium]|nr:2-hydroxyacid dehydrogenase [Candidatus Binataceae bacterium]
MAQENILFVQGIELPSEVLELSHTMAPKDFALRTVPPHARSAAIAEAMREADYMVGFIFHLPDEAYLNAPRLKLIQVLSAGYDMVNIEGARKIRVPICSNGGANSVAVAEHAIMLMLAVYRKLIAFHQNVTAGRWHSGIPRATGIFEIDGKTVGLIGFGNIGEQVARRLKGFNARIIYYDSARREPRDETALGVEYAPLDSLLESADIVSLHTALNDGTRGMIGREALARMKPNAILINTCRGEVVDEEALIEALKEGRLLGAGLDTLCKEPTDPANPILKLTNVVLTPHSAGPTADSFRKRFQNGYANIRRVAGGERPLWIVPEMRDLFA